MSLDFLGQTFGLFFVIAAASWLSFRYGVSVGSGRQRILEETFSVASAQRQRSAALRLRHPDLTEDVS